VSVFACPNCAAIYEVVRHNEPPATAPRCDKCGEELPWGDARDWYSYRLLELATRALAS
jgi:Adenylate kinase, active site lid